MWNLRYIVLLLPLCICACHRTGNTDGSGRVALPSNFVHQIYQDRDGAMWMATYRGLVKYSGGRTRVYRSILYSPELLPENNVIFVCEDIIRRIWIGTESGLSVLDKKTGRIVAVANDKGGSRRVNELLATDKGDVFAAMIRGVERWDTAAKRMKCLGLSDANIQALAEMPDGSIIIGTWGKGLFRYSFDKGIDTLALSDVVKSKTILALHYDNEGRLWAGTLAEGLCQIEEDVNGTWQVVVQYADKNIPSNCVYSIAEGNGCLYAGTRNGLFITGNSHMLTGNEVLGVCVDSDGCLWAATKGRGVYSTSPSLKDSYLTTARPFQVITDRNGGRWASRNYGVAYTPKNAEQAIVLLPSLRPYKMSLASDDRVMISVHDGGVYVGDRGRIVAHYSRSRGDRFIPHDLVHYAMEDSEGNLWVATRKGLGVRYADGQECVFAERQDMPSFMAEETYFMAEDDRGTIWAATDNGMIKYDTVCRHYTVEKDNFPIGMPGAFCQDKAGRIWVGTDGMGLCLYDSINDCFASVHERLFLPGDNVVGIESLQDSSIVLDTGDGTVSLSSQELRLLRRNSDTQPLYKRMWIWLVVALVVFVSAVAVYLSKRITGRKEPDGDKCLEVAVSADVASGIIGRQQAFLDKAAAIVTDRLSDCDFDVQQLADDLSMSRTTLHRRMKEATGMSTTAFIRKIRLQTAERILAASPDIRVSDLAYSVGFGDPKYFSRCFKEMYGKSPGDYSLGNNGAE